jgi:hypothetical protein
MAKVVRMAAKFDMSWVMGATKIFMSSAYMEPKNQQPLARHEEDQI